MKLSQLPIARLSKRPRFLTSSKGTLGKIGSYAISELADDVRLVLTIEWENGAISKLLWPEHCIHIEVNEVFLHDNNRVQ